MLNTETNIYIDEKFTRKLNRLSSCCICSTTQQDNRMTPCFHIACLKCLEDIQSKNNKQHGDVLPCPSCGKTFAIPSEGMTGLHKNLFAMSEIEIENSSDLENEPKTCKTHCGNVLDYYCKDCETVVCVSCFVEYHKFHEGKEVTTIDKDLRGRLEESTNILLIQRQEMLLKRMDLERIKTEFLAKSFQTFKAIVNKSDTIKSLSDQHAQILSDELSSIKQKHQTNMEKEIDDIQRNTQLLDSFVAYCIQKAKGSANALCSCGYNLITKAEELSKENEEYLHSPSRLVEIEFIDTHQDATLQIGDNVIGKLAGRPSIHFIFFDKSLR